MKKDTEQLSSGRSKSLGYVRKTLELKEDLFLAEFEDATGHSRSCVIMFFPDDAQSQGDELGQRRFATEGQLAFDVTRDHVNLLSVLHVGVWEDGRLYQAYDYVAGRSLGELHGTLTGRFADIETIARAVLRGLAHLHRQGVVHGHVRVENILVGSDGVVRLGDYSRVRRVENERLDPGQILAQGAADLQALGRALFTLATDRALVRIKHTDAALPKEVVAALSDTPERLATTIRGLLTADSEFSASTALKLLGDVEQPLLDPSKVEAMIRERDERNDTVRLVRSLDDTSLRTLEHFLNLLEGELDSKATENRPGEARPVAAVANEVPDQAPSAARRLRWPAITAMAVLALSIATWSMMQSRGRDPGVAERSPYRIQRSSRTVEPAAAEVSRAAASRVAEKDTVRSTNAESLAIEKAPERDVASGATRLERDDAPARAGERTQTRMSRDQSRNRVEGENTDRQSSNDEPRWNDVSERVFSASWHDDGIILEVENITYRPEASFVALNIRNDSSRAFHVADINIRGAIQPVIVSTSIQFSDDWNAGCLDGRIVAPQTSCKLVVRAEWEANLKGKLMVITVSNGSSIQLATEGVLWWQ